jgi:hypothetical protein
MSEADRLRAIATLCHEAQRVWCTLNDWLPVMPAWEEAPAELQREALDTVTELIKHPGMSAADFHNDSVELARRRGWTYGPVHDPGLKQTPRLLPWHKLGYAQQSLDGLVVAIVRATETSIAPPLEGVAQ